ncbi:MAG: DUF975 family protein [Aristaeellaceae bacterium]
MPNALLRLKARNALKPMLPVILLCALIANLPSLITQTVSVLTDSNPLTYLLSQASTDAELMAILEDDARLTAMLQEYISAPSHLLSLGLSALSWLLSPVLTLGLTWCLLELLRGREIAVTTVFARLSCFWRSIGLNLLTALKLLAWSLPGIAVMFAGMVMLLLTGSSLAMLLYFAGLILMTVLMVRAMLHYTMASVFLADEPDRGVRGSLRASVDMMRTRKMSLFSLLVTFFLWMMVLSMLTSVLSALLGTVIASTVSMLLQLMLSVYMQASICAFYEAYRAR